VTQVARSGRSRTTIWTAREGRWIEPNRRCEEPHPRRQRGPRRRIDRPLDFRPTGVAAMQRLVIVNAGLANSGLCVCGCPSGAGAGSDGATVAACVPTVPLSRRGIRCCPFGADATATQDDRDLSRTPPSMTGTFVFIRSRPARPSVYCASTSWTTRKATRSLERLRAVRDVLRECLKARPLRPCLSSRLPQKVPTPYLSKRCRSAVGRDLPHRETLLGVCRGTLS
jgi:hypothetical protein